MWKNFTFLCCAVKERDFIDTTWRLVTFSIWRLKYFSAASWRLAKKSHATKVDYIAWIRTVLGAMNSNDLPLFLI